MINLFLLFFITPNFYSYLSKEVNISYDYGIVFEEKWIDSVFLGIESVKTLSSYLAQKTRESMVKKFLSQTKERLKKESLGSLVMEGLIPKIEIPGFEEETSIDISGSDQITVGMGSTKYAEGQSVSIEPEMKQDIKVKVLGTIARKTQVEMDYSSQREVQAENTIRITYQGDEDEVTEYIKAGDISLTMPTTVMTGGLPTHKGLFGFSGKWRFGPLTLYAVASKEEATSTTQEFTQGINVEEKKDSIYDYQYEKERFFTILNDSIKKYLGDDTIITGVGVYVFDYTTPDRITKPAVATPYGNLYPEYKPYDSREEITKGNFYPLVRNEEFYFHEGTGIIELTKSFYGNYILAVACTTSTGRKLFSYNGDTLILLLVWPENPDSSLITWKNELRNVYSVGDVNIKNLKITIVRISPGDATELETEGPAKGKSFAEILGIDADGDGMVDAKYMDPSRGLVWFPYREPFNHSDLSVRDSSIYLTRYVSDPKYKIIFSYTRPLQYQLPVGIKEGTVRIWVNGEELSEDEFSVNYATGVVTIKRPVPAGAEIKITAEQTPFFINPREGSIAGIRAETKLTEDATIGWTFLYRNEKERGVIRPTIGSEPYSRAITALDLKIDKELGGITEFLDRLPLISTDEPSTINFETDVGISMPNPNTMGTAYIEDFEGIEESDELVITKRWYPPSIPVSKDSAIETYSRRRPQIDVVTINKRDVFGEVTGDVFQNLQDVLRIVYTPEDSTRWSGIMTALVGGEVFDITDKDNLEFIFKTDAKKGRIYIDFGSDIDEDMLRLDKDGNIRGLDTLDTEDKNGNMMLNLGEDTGLDGIAGKDGEEVAGDDGNDDYDEKTNLMGTEGNGMLDTEDIDQDWGWNGGSFTRNDYYEVMIDLEKESEYIEELENGWKLLRIPLSDSSAYKKFGSPQAKLINEFRVWFEGMEGVDTLYIYSLKFQGTVWKGLSVYKEDTTSEEPDTTEKVSIAPVNREIDPEYTSPFKLRKDISGQYEIENALELKYENIKPGHGVKIYRYSTDPLDLRGYKKISIYIHGDEESALFFLKIGTDSLNYYEYRNKINAGKKVEYGEGWREFEIDLAGFASIKKDSIQSDTLKFYGDPTLANIRYLSLGIINGGEGEISGKVWFNDIRVKDPWREKGVSFTGRLKFKLADVGFTTVNFSRSDPNFVSFSDPTGVKAGGLTNNLSVFTQANIDKLFPKKAGFKIPLGITYTRRTSTPKFSPYVSDYRIGKKEAEEFTETSDNKGFKISFSKNKKSKNKFLNYTIDALNLSTEASLNHNLRNATKNLDSTRSFNTKASYRISPQLFMKVKGRKIYFIPNSISLTLSQNYSYSRSWSRVSPDESFGKPIYADERKTFVISSSATHSFIERFLSFSAVFSNTRDLKEPNYVRGINIGRDAGKNLRLTYSISGVNLKDFGRPGVSVQTDYQENHSIDIQIDTFDTRNLNNSFNLNASWPGINTGGIIEKIKFIFPQKDTVEKKGSPRWLIHTFASILKKVRPLEVSYGYSKSSSYQYYLGVPSTRYILGFEDSIPLYGEDSTVQYLGTGSRRREHRLSLETGATVGDINLNLRANKNASFTLNFGQTNFSYSYILPSVSLNIYNLSKHIKKFLPTLQNASLNSSFERKKTYNGTIEYQDNGGMIADTNAVTEEMNFSPLVSLSTYWKRKVTLTAQVTHQDTRTIRIFGELGTTVTRYKKTDYEFSAGYLFSAPSGLKIPWLRNVRFKNDLNLNATFMVSEIKNSKYDESTGEEDVLIDDIEKQLTVSASYNFSNTFTGGLNFIYKSKHSRVNPRYDYSQYRLDVVITIKF